MRVGSIIILEEHRPTHATTPCLHGNEMPCRIQHQTTPLEARMIVDLQGDHLAEHHGDSICWLNGGQVVYIAKHGG